MMGEWFSWPPSAEFPPEGDERAFAVVVERAVRSLAWPVDRVARLRGELLTHLREARDEALAAGMTSEEAIRQAVVRFGDPAEVGTSLQRVAGWDERLCYAVGRIFGPRLDESLEVFAVRFFAAVLTVVAGVFGAATPSLASAGRITSGVDVATLVYTAFYIACFATGFMYFGLKFQREWCGGTHRRGWAAVWLILLAAVFPGCHLALAGLTGATWDQLTGRAQLAAQGPPLLYFFGVIATVGLGLFVGFASERERRYRMAWARVVAGDALV